MDVEVIRYRDEFYPAGFRKLFALMLLTAVTVLPATFSWLGSPAERPPTASMPTGRYRPTGGFLREPEPPRAGVLQTMVSAMKWFVLLSLSTLAVAMYYPRRGFKRYALLCGPLLAVLGPFCVSQYLSGRTQVFRAEILVVTLVALAPGVALYVWLTWRKARRLGMEW